MKKALTLIALSCIFILQSCKYNTEWQTVNAGKDFSLSLPPWLEKVDNLKEGAALQYSSRYRNFYVIGETITENRTPQEVLAGNIERLKKSLQRPVVSDSVAVTIGGLNGTRVEVYGRMSDEAIYFSEVLLPGKTGYYHISVWTRGEDRKLRYKEDINKILTSFKVL